MRLWLDWPAEIWRTQIVSMVFMGSTKVDCGEVTNVAPLTARPPPRRNPHSPSRALCGFRAPPRSRDVINGENLNPWLCPSCPCCTARYGSAPAPAGLTEPARCPVHAGQRALVDGYAVEPTRHINNGPDPEKVPVCQRRRRLPRQITPVSDRGADCGKASSPVIGKHHSQHGRQMRDPSEVEQLHRRARRSRFVHAVCDDLNCPLRPEVALAEICKSKTLISFAVGAPVEIAQPFGLQAIGDHAVEQMARQMIGGLAAKHRMPSCPQATEIEIAQMRDLVLQFAH